MTDSRLLKRAEINLQELGAAGDGQADDSEALRLALDQLSTSGGTLYIPAGDYYIASPATVFTESAGMAIKGAGAGVCRFLVEEGCIAVHDSRRNAQLYVSGLSFVALNPGSGRAFEFTMPEGGNQHQRSLVMQDVEFKGADVTSDYFDYGVYTEGMWRPLFSNVIVAGPYGPDVDQYDESSIQYQATCGIYAAGAYDPAFESCYVWSAKTGYYTGSDQRPGPEAASFTRCIAVGCVYGIRAQTASGEPLLFVDGSHINCLRAGITVTGKRLIRVSGSLLYNYNWAATERPPVTYTDIQLNDCSQIMVSSNQFHMHSNDDRLAVSLLQASHDAMISGNYFNNGGQAIRAGSDCYDIAERGNKFTGSVTRRINDLSGSLDTEPHSTRIN